MDESNANVVGYLMGIMAFDAYLVDLLPDGVRGIHVIVENTCNSTFTYELDGNSAIYLGEGDFHDRNYDHLERRIDFNENYRRADTPTTPGHCVFNYRVYPSKEFEGTSSLPWVLSISVAIIFAVMTVTFFIYDR